MKVQYTVSITAKVDSLDSVPAMLQEVTTLMMKEIDTGKLEYNDSDKIEWVSNVKEVK